VGGDFLLTADELAAFVGTATDFNGERMEGRRFKASGDTSALETALVSDCSSILTDFKVSREEGTVQDEVFFGFRVLCVPEPPRRISGVPATTSGEDSCGLAFSPSPARDGD
jgi:hypothetical protein